MVFCEVLSYLGVPLVLFVLYKVIDRLVRLPRVARCEDRYILVTGCGQGIGFEAVKRLDRLGCHVFAGCRKEEQVELLERTFSDRVQSIQLDITNGDSVRKAFEFISDQLPKNTGLWGLINNAGIGQVLPFELLTVPMYEKMVSTNLCGTIDVTMTFLPLIKKAKGRILNVSSYSGRIVLPIVVSYCVSKYGLEAFTDGLRRSLRPYGCKALLVEPGSVKTNILSAEQIVTDFEREWRLANSSDVLTAEDEKILEEEKEKIFQLINGYPVYGSVEYVVDAYEQALFSIVPRDRYVVGIDAKVLLILQSLPEWLSDWAICSSLPKFRCRIR